MTYSQLQDQIHRAMIYDPPEPPHDPPLRECRWSMPHRDRHQCDCVCALPARHFCRRFRRQPPDPEQAAVVAAIRDSYRDGCAEQGCPICAVDGGGDAA